MNNKELFEQRLISLHEAQNPTDLKNKLVNKSEDLFEHLLKLYYWRNTQTKDYWAKEAGGEFLSVSKLTTTKKLPTSEFIKSALYEKWQNDSDFNRIISKIMRDPKYAQYAKTFPIKKITYGAKVFCERYIDWLSDILSSTGSHTTDEGKYKLYELLDIDEAENNRW